MKSIPSLIKRRLWPETAPTRPALRQLLVLARYLYALGRDLARGEISLRAMSLVYTTMLAIVPMLGFAFAIAKVLGFHNELRPWLERALEPIGSANATEVTGTVIGFAENINGGILGFLSLALLLVAVLSMARKVEGAFNFVWRVDRPRGFARRFSEYLSVILIGLPIMFATASVITALSTNTAVTALERVAVIGVLFRLFGAALPYFMIIAVFTFLYLFIPNTRVRFVPALTGAFAGGLAWAVSGFLFARLVAASASMQSIYSGFAIVLLLMFWLYISWLVLLLGSSIAFYVQHPYQLRHGQRTEPIDNDARERLCLSVMFLIASDYARPSHGWTPESLAAVLQVPRDALEPVMAALGEAGLIVRTDEQRLIPGRDPHRTTLTEILETVRGRSRRRVAPGADGNGSIDAIVDRIDAAIEAELGGRTLGQLVDAQLGGDAGDR